MRDIWEFISVLALRPIHGSLYLRQPCRTSGEDAVWSGNRRHRISAKLSSRDSHAGDIGSYGPAVVHSGMDRWRERLVVAGRSPFGLRYSVHTGCDLANKQALAHYGTGQAIS